jgi:hypothetical protein
MVTLNELETMQEDLLTLVSERFDDLSMKIENLRANLDILPNQVSSPIPTPSSAISPEEETEEDTLAQTDSKEDVEKRIEKIRKEVEQVLEKLSKVETDV